MIGETMQKKREYVRTLHFLNFFYKLKNTIKTQCAYFFSECNVVCTVTARKQARTEQEVVP